MATRSGVSITTPGSGALITSSIAQVKVATATLGIILLQLERFIAY
jgi:hypothetical protein